VDSFQLLSTESSKKLRLMKLNWRVRISARYKLIVNRPNLNSHIAKFSQVEVVYTAIDQRSSDAVARSMPMRAC